MLRDLGNNNNNNGGGSGSAGNNNRPGPSGKPSNNPHARAVRVLMQELKGIQDEPVEGFRVGLMQESDLFHWEVAIFGPPDTPYAGKRMSERVWLLTRII